MPAHRDSRLRQPPHRPGGPHGQPSGRESDAWLHHRPSPPRVPSRRDGPLDTTQTLINHPERMTSMRVGILYSGGKDSTYAIAECHNKGWEIAYLLSVKPSRTDCFLFHYATVEHTPALAKILKLPHRLIGCDVADPQKEAE